jgi:hypothetical protein
VEADRVLADVRVEDGAGEGDDGVRGEGERRPEERHLETRRTFVVADEEVRRTQCHSIHRTRRRDTEASEPRTAEVLNGRQRARLEHDDRAPFAHRATKRTRSPGESSAGGSRSGSKSRTSVRPISRQPPGVALG